MRLFRDACLPQDDGETPTDAWIDLHPKSAFPSFRLCLQLICDQMRSAYRIIEDMDKLGLLEDFERHELELIQDLFFDREKNMDQRKVSQSVAALTDEQINSIPSLIEEYISKLLMLNTRISSINGPTFDRDSLNAFLGMCIRSLRTMAVKFPDTLRQCRQAALAEQEGADRENEGKPGPTSEKA